ncbi:hypothetical protein [Enterovibrio norvegicus]|uniref:hypothetical protein n=1 Tax=Enterovibrio norvegicus TaxID=188144 RepID=UPI0013D7EEED|nr:hypothetical protein [Enterovibrio norvegicus]
MAVTLHDSERWLDDTTPSFVIKIFEEDEQRLNKFNDEISSKARVIYRAAHRSGGESANSNLTRIDARISAYARKISCKSGDRHFKKTIILSVSCVSAFGLKGE